MVVILHKDYKGEIDMKKIWKWVIGIVLGLVVLALLVGAGFAFRTGSLGCGARARNGFDQDGRGFGMMPYGGMHRGFGMMPFGGFFGGLISLGVLALIVLGILWLVRSLRKPAVPAAPVVPAVPALACRNCGNPVESGWRNCPHCGKKL
jgi:hypothetical protein